MALLGLVMQKQASVVLDHGDTERVGAFRSKTIGFFTDMVGFCNDFLSLSGVEAHLEKYSKNLLIGGVSETNLVVGLVEGRCNATLTFGTRDIAYVGVSVTEADGGFLVVVRLGCVDWSQWREFSDTKKGVLTVKPKSDLCRFTYTALKCAAVIHVIYGHVVFSPGTRPVVVVSWDSKEIRVKGTLNATFNNGYDLVVEFSPKDGGFNIQRSVRGDVYCFNLPEFARLLKDTTSFTVGGGPVFRAFLEHFDLRLDTLLLSASAPRRLSGTGTCARRAPDSASDRGSVVGEFVA